MIRKVTSKSGRKMHKDMGRATNNIDSIMCIKSGRKVENG